jgi:hypothetical protein
MRRVMTMKTIGNERGVALVTALLLSLIVLGMVMALLYYVTQGVTQSAANKRYHSAREAAYGGMDVVSKQIMPDVLGNYSTSYLSTVLAGVQPTYSNLPCFQSKLNNATSQWSGACTADSRTPEPKVLPDVTIKLKGPPLSPNFNVYAKIVDSQPGNSDATSTGPAPGGTGGVLDGAAGVAYSGPVGGGSGSSETVTPMHIPGMYRIEVQGESETNPLERSRLSALYVY